MTIQTERLIIQEISWDDAEDIHTIHSIPEVDEYNTLAIPEDIEETKKLIRSAIEDQTSKTRKEFA